MTVSNLRKLEQQFLADSRLTDLEAKQLLDSTRDYGAVSSSEKTELKAMLVRDASKLDRLARERIEKFLGLAPAAPAIPEVIKSVAGPSASSFADDAIFLGRDGALHGEAGVTAYTRGYDATKTGPLRIAHGSVAPASPFPTEKTPGRSLDAAAKAFGVPVDGFEKMAGSKQFFDDDAEFWWGKCHAWAWAALDNRINALVDVDGPEAAKGVWIGGQWLSRADLGNWMMAVADEISLNDPQTMFKGQLTASDLVKGTAQFMMNEGGGVVADVFNDAKKGRKEVWNHPFVSSDFTTRTLEDPSSVLKLATRDGVASGVSAKLLTIKGTYAVETTDSHEGSPVTSSKTWNVYAVTDASGKMVGAYMADDAKLKGAGGLPTRWSDDLPEYFWKPKLQAIDDVLAGRSNWNVETDRHGAEFKFFVGTVLTKGVPGTVRAAFEREVGTASPAELARRYPGVANAYSPEQWRSTYAVRGLDAKTFGARWQ